MRNLIASLLIALAVGGCAKTRITGFTDPAFIGRSYSSAAVLAVAGGLEQSVRLEDTACRYMQAHGVTCERMTTLFPPTRSYSADDLYGALKAKGIGSVLILTAQKDRSESHVALYQSYTTANASANAYGASGTGYGTNIPIYSSSRESSSRAELMDCDSRKLVWIGDAITKGKGRFGTSDEKFMRSLAKTSVDSLAKAGHLRSGEGTPPGQHSVPADTK